MSSYGFRPGRSAHQAVKELSARGCAAAQARHCAPLRQVLDDIWRGGNELADALARRYFTHLDARSRATASL